MQSCLITNMYANIGGGEIAVLAHVRHLLAEGVRVHLALLESGRLGREAALLGADVTDLPFAFQGNKWKTIRLITKRIRDFVVLLRRIRPEILISYTFNDLVIAGTAARILGIPVLYRSQGEIFPPRETRGRTWLGGFLRPFLRFVRARIVCTTRAEAKAFVSFGMPISSVAHVYLGVAKTGAANRQSDSPVDRPPMATAPIVAIFGRLVRWKGQDVFLRALGELRTMDVAFEAWIVGGSSFGDGVVYEDELHELAHELGISRQVRFLGDRSDVPLLMGVCDVVCHCSRFEPFGLVVVEAMMAARPVVASDVSGPRESVVDGETGILVPPGDWRAVANALRELLGDQARAAQMGEAGRRRAEDLFDLERNLKRLDAECEYLIRPQPDRPNTHKQRSAAGG